MKSLLLVALSLAVAGMAQAADTAYSALRAIGKRDGQEVLNHVLELRGKDGMPSPAVWKVVIEDQRARGGIRELEIQKGKIVGESTPTSRNLGNAMNFTQLNIDSEGAFTVANQEVQKQNIPFDRINYMLKSGSNGGSPVWELELYDGRNGRAGTVTIAADSGNVLHSQLQRPGRAPATDDHAYLDDRNAPPRDDRQAHDNGNGDDHSNGPGGLPGFLNRIGRHFEKRGRQIENFFTGH